MRSSIRVTWTEEGCVIRQVEEFMCSDEAETVALCPREEKREGASDDIS